MIPRSRGDHHPRWRRLTFIGKRPHRYAPSTVPGWRSPPTATRSSGPATLGSGKLHRETGGSTGDRNQLATPSISMLPVWAVRDRRLWSAVSVEALARLPAEVPGGDHPAQGGDG